MFQKMEKKRKIKVNNKSTFSNMKLSAAFHGSLSLNQQKKIPQILNECNFLVQML